MSSSGTPRKAPFSLSADEKQRMNRELLPERDNVQVYKDAFDLLVFIYRTTSALRREHRYTLGEEMKRAVQQLLAAIYEANKGRPRADYIARAQHWCYEAKVLYRTMDELHLLKDRQCVEYVRLLATISKQLTAWHRYEKRKEQQTPCASPDGA